MTTPFFRLIAIAACSLMISFSSLAKGTDSLSYKSKLVFYPFDMINSGLTIGYERALPHPHWTVAAMLGYKSTEYSDVYDGSVSGLYSELQFRYYFNPGGWNRKLSAYGCPFVSYKYTSMNRFYYTMPGWPPYSRETNVNVTNFGFLMGVRLQTSYRLALDFNLGPGLLTSDTKIGQDFGLDRYRSGWNLHGNLGVGFMF